jgi:hypothetical protein
MNVMLDTNAWTALIISERITADQLSLARDRLSESVRSGSIAAISTIPILEELAGTIHNDKQTFGQLRDLATTTVGNHWLKDMNVRYAQELAEGGLLDHTSRYWNREARREIQRVSMDNLQIKEIADQTHVSSDNFKQLREDLRTTVLQKFDAAGITKKLKYAEMKKWWPKRDTRLWVRGAISTSVQKGYLPQSDDYGASEAMAPSLWFYMEYQLAKMRFELGENRKILGSDRVDGDIYGAFPYIDQLVTNDKDLREIIRLLNPARVKVLTSEAFIDGLLKE